MSYFEGSLSSKIAFIGESPGSNEVAQGRPFVGSAGELLDTLMHTVGILRSECYLDNVMQQRPASNSNDIGIHIRFDKYGNCTWMSDTMRREQVSLYERLKASKANIFVPLGNIPMFMLTGQYFITKRRGSILTCCDQVQGTSLGALRGRKVIPTFHPSGVLHGEYLNKWFISFDLLRVKEECETPQCNLPQRIIHMHPTLHEALDFIAHCHSQEAVGFDIEISRRTHEMTCFSLAISPYEGMSIPLFYSKGDYFNPEDECKVIKELGYLLENKKVKKINQYINFDASFMMRRYGIHTTNMDDTMIAMHILYPEFPKDLGVITSLYTREPYYKDDSRYATDKELSNDERFWRYNALDSLVVMEAFPKLIADIERCGNLATYKRQAATIEPLLYIGEIGFPIDVDGMKAAAIATRASLDEKYQRLYSLCGFPLNINSPKQLQSYFYVSKGYSPYYKEGALTVDVKALRRLAAKGAKEASLIIEMKHLDKLCSTYYEMIIDADKRLRCAWNPAGTKWSRLSSSQTISDSTGGNMQNLTTEMKALMHPDPGYILVSVDLSMAENRIVGYIANEQKMIEAFEAGIDLDSLTYALTFNKPVEEVVKKVQLSTW